MFQQCVERCDMHRQIWMGPRVVLHWRMPNNLFVPKILKIVAMNFIFLNLYSYTYRCSFFPEGQRWKYLYNVSILVFLRVSVTIAISTDLVTSSLSKISILFVFPLTFYVTNFNSFILPNCWSLVFGWFIIIICLWVIKSPLLALPMLHRGCLVMRLPPFCLQAWRIFWGISFT